MHLPVFTATTPWAPWAEAKQRSGGQFRRKKRSVQARASVAGRAAAGAARYLLAVDRARVGANAQVLDAADDDTRRKRGGRVGEQLGNGRALARLERQVVGDPDRAVEAENGGAVDVAGLDQVVIDVGLPRHVARVESWLRAVAGRQIVREKLIFFFFFLFTGANSFCFCRRGAIAARRSPPPSRRRPPGARGAAIVDAARAPPRLAESKKIIEKFFCKKKKKKSTHSLRESKS